MKSILSKLPYLFAVVTLGVGIGMLAFAISYTALRDRYIGRVQSGYVSAFEAQSYQERQHELTLLSGLTGGGAGLLTASLASFLLIAWANRSAESLKGKLPEV